MDKKLLKSYLPSLSELQIDQLFSLEPFYKEWNEKINLISRKDMDAFMTHHVLHSITLARYMNFKSGTEIMDLGTGGGFPGIPLAIVYPEVQFHLIDGTGKKIMVVNEAIKYLGIQNVKADHIRIEQLTTKYDFITARAVTSMIDLLHLTRSFFKSKHQNARPNGLIAYKGFPLRTESSAVKKIPHEIFKLHEKIKEEYFEEKCIVYVPVY